MLYPKAILIIALVFIIWAEYEELSSSLTSLDIGASSSASNSVAGTPTSVSHSKSKREVPETRRRRSTSKEKDMKEKLIKIMFQVFLLRGMRRKLVTPGTPADAALIVASMLFMICLMCIIWFAFIIGVIKLLERIWDKINSYQEATAENREREQDLEEFREAYVENENDKPTSVTVRRGRKLRHSH